MAHIIALMDDTLHATARGYLASAASEPKRRVASVKQQRRMAEPAFAGADGNDAAPVRMDRVKTLRESIANGTYHVSASDLADKILHSMLQK